MYKNRMCPVCYSKVTTGYDLVENKETWKVSAVYFVTCPKCGVKVSAEHSRIFDLFPAVEAVRVEIKEEPILETIYEYNNIGGLDTILYCTGFNDRVDTTKTTGVDYRRNDMFTTCNCGGDHVDKCRG